MDRSTFAKLEALNAEVVLQQFLDDGDKSPATRSAYEYDVRVFFDWAAAAKIHPLTATHTDLNRFIRQVLEGSGLARNTWARRYTAVRSFFAFVADQWGVPSPMNHPEIVPGPNRHSPDQPPLILDVDAFTRLMSVALTELAPGAGLGLGLVGINALKPSEVTAANVDDLTDDGHQLTLRLTGRSGDAAATPLFGAVADLARDTVRGRSRGRPLVRNQAGNRVSYENLHSALQKAKALAEVETVTLNMLRATAGAVAALNGASATALQQMLGISSRRLQAFLALTSALPEEHGAARVWRRIGNADQTGNDLLDQVDRLLGDPQTIPIAPVALAGAALEQHLRRLCEIHHAEVKGEPSIDRYKGALIRVKKLPSKAAKRIEVWADLRNDAAHGRRDITRDEAREMAAAVRRFIESPLVQAGDA
jgi:site-specific recombinase XerD